MFLDFSNPKEVVIIWIFLRPFQITERITVYNEILSACNQSTETILKDNILIFLHVPYMYITLNENRFYDYYGYKQA